MKRMLRAALAGVAAVSVAVAAALVGAPPAQAASLVQVTSFGTNPSNLRMYVYVPNSVAAHPAVQAAIAEFQGEVVAVRPRLPEGEGQ